MLLPWVIWAVALFTVRQLVNAELVVGMCVIRTERVFSKDRRVVINPLNHNSLPTMARPRSACDLLTGQIIREGQAS